MFKVWDLDQLSCVSQLPAQSSQVKAVAVDASQRMLITAGDRVIQLWDLASLTNIHTFKSSSEDTRALCVDEEN